LKRQFKKILPAVMGKKMPDWKGFAWVTQLRCLLPCPPFKPNLFHLTAKKYFTFSGVDACQR